MSKYLGIVVNSLGINKGFMLYMCRIIDIILLSKHPLFIFELHCETL